MLTNLLFIAIFGYFGYLLAPKLKLSGSRRVNVILLVLLVLSFYVHADIIHIFSVVLDASTILIGLIGGVLLRRLM